MVLLDSEFFERDCITKMDKANKKASGINRRKFGRGLPDSLGVLNSLVVLDDAEMEVSKVGCKTEAQKRTTTVGRQTDVLLESDAKLTRNLSEPFPSRTLDHEAAPTLLKTLSQDWFNTSFSPRPGREPRRGLAWESGCLHSQHLLRNVPSLRSIPKGSELDHDDGSELSDDNFIVEVDSRRTSLHGKRNTPATGSIGDEHERGKKCYS